MLWARFSRNVLDIAIRNFIRTNKLIQMEKLNEWYSNKQKEFTKAQHRIILIAAFIGAVLLMELAMYLVGNKGVFGMIGRVIPASISIFFGSFSLQAIVNNNYKK